MHNSSMVRWVTSGEARWIYYVDPRPGLPVAPETLLFEGQRVGNKLVGTAGCGFRFCDVVDYTWDSHNAALYVSTT